MNKLPTFQVIEPIINVVKRGKEWRVEFWIGNQGFELAYGGTKAEATWMMRMLKQAFKSITLEYEKK